ncbi:nucleoside triphosphate pyrophosphohydrolase family protein [Gallibacterium salpingitidis]|uniref:nucleoside triphosphate pyrophosphohydrolase family protein n=1 Tax=Gallibacterium salpingitidis TaxID=505341 RepID=UPI00266F9907|nr:nucleoside triphosphate pyrophosphohydrolase family protein [Gallibacterium salpingitidis]WKT00487.1 nucleoside triphosphate pyrophosphohydrolase family protein [Gallibacterium salpingitidis]
MRKVIQISESITQDTEYADGYWSLIALCDDGTLWNKSSLSDNVWIRIEDVPQDDKQHNELQCTNEQQHNELQRILDWFKEAKPGPTNKDIAVQIGCHFEEVSEMLASLGELEQSRKLLILANNSYKKNSEEMGVILKQLNTNMKIEILDALCDQIVTAVGVGYMFGFDVLGALREVNDSNWSKFEDGKAVFDENGKIKKGANYFKPDLEKFLG